MKKITALYLLPVLVLLFVTITSCGGGDGKAAAGKKDKYEETKEDLAATEKKSPVRFLSVSGHDKKNLIGQTVVKGTLTSKATVAAFKDVEVELSFFSKTGSLLEKDIETIYETVKPGTSTDFKTKYFAPKGTDSVALKILSAKTE